MDGRKYLIFVSSSFVDLKEERKAIIDEILEVGHFPSGMEMFSAGNEEDLEVIKRAIDLCDIYVVLIGARFGSVRDDRSYTQIEFQYAKESGKPILAFLLGRTKKEYESERKNILNEHPLDANYEADLIAFRNEVKKIGEDRYRLVDYFNKKDLGGIKAVFGNALGKLIASPTFNMPGWIRSNDELFSIGPVGKNRFIKNIILRLKEYDVLAQRITENAPLKLGSAAYFWDQCSAEIIESEYFHLFFESGSTIAYLSSEFLNRLSEPQWRSVIARLQIKTNNILTYLETVLTTNIKIEIRPYGPPERSYGATFRDLTKLPKHSAPGPMPLKSDAIEAIDEMANTLKSKGGKMMFLATASGLNIDQTEYPIGYHVGSYYNKLFKRAMVKAGSPMVLFIDAKKFQKPFNPAHCYSVFGNDLPWEDICASHPLALCVGAADKGEREFIIEKIMAFGFTYIDTLDEPEKYGCWPLIARNVLFNNILPSPSTFLMKP